MLSATASIMQTLASHALDRGSKAVRGASLLRRLLQLVFEEDGLLASLPSVGPYSELELVESRVLAIIAQERYERPGVRLLFAGHSLGGWFAGRIARRAALGGLRDVKGLVLMSSFYPKWEMRSVFESRSTSASEREEIETECLNFGILQMHDPLDLVVPIESARRSRENLKLEGMGKSWGNYAFVEVRNLGHMGWKNTSPLGDVVVKTICAFLRGVGPFGKSSDESLRDALKVFEKEKRTHRDLARNV